MSVLAVYFNLLCQVSRRSRLPWWIAQLTETNSGEPLTLWTLSGFCDSIYNFIRNKIATSRFRTLLRWVKFSFGVAVFLLFPEREGTEFAEGEYNLLDNHTLWTVEYGVVKRIIPAVTAILHPGISPYLPIRKREMLSIYSGARFPYSLDTWCGKLYSKI